MQHCCTIELRREFRHAQTLEYALRDLKKPIGVAQWQTQLVSSLPEDLKGSLPTIEEIEAELEEKLEAGSGGGEEVQSH
ncbi:MAG: hypothetical protein QF473_37670 [Planctomycetota bacterium]|jgi:hypothetical protein|nr:hypothetical protein [Planctomycetota bacterium]